MERGFEGFASSVVASALPRRVSGGGETLPVAPRGGELRPASAGGTATQAEREAAAAAALQHVRLDAQGVLTTDASTGPTTGPAEATGSMGGTVVKRGVSIGASFSIVSVDETPCGVAIRGFDVVQTRPLRCEVRAKRGGPRRRRRLSAHAYIHRTEQFPL